MSSGIAPIDSTPTNTEVATWINDTLMPVLDGLLRSDNTLGDGEIRQRHLHAEVGGVFRLFTAHLDNGCNTLAPCRLATIGNHGLSGLADIDGETPIAGDRILVRAQTDPTENGVYIAAAGAWARATDADTMANIGYSILFVDGGDTLSASNWICDAGVTGTIETVDIVWKKFARSSLGPQGVQGIPGADGADGADGGTGPQGDPGRDGLVGYIGAITGSKLANGTITIDLYVAAGAIITAIKTQFDADGAATVSLAINGTPITGSSHSATSSIVTGTCTAARTVVLGDKVTLTIAGKTGTPTVLYYTILATAT